METTPTIDTKELTDLRQMCGRLLALVNGNADVPLTCGESDHLGFMTICFVNKQMEHLRSVTTLVATGSHRDAALIARSMLEGLALLLWATHNPGDQRPWRWRVYAWIDDWRLLRKQESAGFPIDSTLRESIDTNVRQHGELFYTKEARNRLQEGEVLPDDPYQTKWDSTNVETMLKVVGGQDLYELYRKTSWWTHSVIGGVGRAIRRDQASVSYIHEDSAMAAIALVLGFQALFETVELFDRHFERGLAEHLAPLRAEYLASRGIVDDPSERATTEDGTAGNPTP